MVKGPSEANYDQTESIVPLESQSFYIVSKLSLRWSSLLLRGSKHKKVLVPSVVSISHSASLFISRTFLWLCLIDMCFF